jgi:putative transposase
MPNHVHLFGEIKQKGDLAKFMHDINRSYTAYFNETYNKVGHLWQGRFKSKVVVKDEYLINCINYVELNPVRVSMVRVPHEYKWSSYMERSLSTKKRRLLDSLIL